MHRAGLFTIRNETGSRVFYGFVARVLEAVLLSSTRPAVAVGDYLLHLKQQPTAVCLCVLTASVVHAGGLVEALRERAHEGREPQSVVSTSGHHTYLRSPSRSMLRKAFAVIDLRAGKIHGHLAGALLVLL
jgi:hypothetical protein